jgi:hypothetical protein
LCAESVPTARLPLGDVGAAAGNDLHQAIGDEHADSLAGGQPRHLKPLHELSLRRHRGARGA